MDIAYADELGYRIKLLGNRAPDASWRRTAGACLHGAVGAVIAKVDGVYNAVVTNGNFVGQNVVIGRGAGQGPDRLRRGQRPHGHRARPHPAGLLRAGGKPEEAASAPAGSHVGPYYLRLMVVDRPGVIADIAAAMRERECGRWSDDPARPRRTVPVVLTTHDTTEILDRPRGATSWQHQFHFGTTARSAH